MSQFVRDLPNRPIMIEGYSTQGAPHERYLRARQRAAAIEEYLQAKFHLDGELTGIMPLAGAAPEGTGKTVWDRVALVLLR